MSGETVTTTIGTLHQGDSAQITFQVVVNDPYTGGPNVSNQGTVSGSNFLNVLTDDPAFGGSADPTLTPINTPPAISAQDASAIEPTSGMAPMLFTVTLDKPAPVTGVMVNYATADDSGGAHPATGGGACNGTTVDYITQNGTVSFASGEQVKTVSVNICADTPEGFDETLLLNLSGAVGGNISDAQAVGTIRQSNTAGTFLISELRTSGPGGLGDDFVELYNNTNSPLTVAASDASAGYGLFKMGTDCNAAPVLIGTIPNGTVIPARGHYLLVGSQYSLKDYGGTNAALGNLTLTSDIESDHNVAVFSTATLANVSSANRLDAVGFGTNTGGNVCDLLREGNTLAPVAGSATEHSFFRKECDFMGGVCVANGNPKDSNDNVSDFLFADTASTIIGGGPPQQLGAPGPENMTSPIRRDSTISTLLLDATKPATAAPNRVLSSTPVTNGANGTISIRRRFVNNTGAGVTKLRFRIIEISTSPQTGSNADLRALTSADVLNVSVNDSATCTAAGQSTPCMLTVKGTTLESPPTQTMGGGYNSTMSVALGGTLASGASVDVQFLLGRQVNGNVRFYIIVEALP